MSDAAKEKESLIRLISQYTDELLKIAIGQGVDELPDGEAAFSEGYQRILRSMVPVSGKLLDGIGLLYISDAARANARMRQYFEAVQKIPNIRSQLDLCYAMLRCLGVGNEPLSLACPQKEETK